MLAEELSDEEAEEQPLVPQDDYQAALCRRFCRCVLAKALGSKES